MLLRWEALNCCSYRLWESPLCSIEYKSSMVHFPKSQPSIAWLSQGRMLQYVCYSMFKDMAFSEAMSADGLPSPRAQYFLNDGKWVRLKGACWDEAFESSRNMEEADVGAFRDNSLHFCGRVATDCAYSAFENTWWMFGGLWRCSQITAGHFQDPPLPLAEDKGPIISEAGEVLLSVVGPRCPAASWTVHFFCRRAAWGLGQWVEASIVRVERWT